MRTFKTGQPKNNGAARRIRGHPTVIFHVRGWMPGWNVVMAFHFATFLCFLLIFHMVLLTDDQIDQNNQYGQAIILTFI